MTKVNILISFEDPKNKPYKIMIERDVINDFDLKALQKETFYMIDTAGSLINSLIIEKQKKDESRS